MPRKLRQLVQDLRNAGFQTVPGGGRGSHRKFVHPRFPGVVTISGQDGNDAKRYQERQVRHAIDEVRQ